MLEPMRLLSVALASMGLLLAGCGEGDHDADGHHDNDLDAAGHDEGYQDGDNDAAQGDGENSGHGEERMLGSVTIGEVVLAVVVAGDIEPGAEAHINVNHNAGPTPAAIRVWIGVESGEGSVKAKADLEDGHYHAHVQTPATIADGAGVWIEVEDESGARDAASVPMN